MKLLSELDYVHPMFYVYMLKKCIGDPVSILSNRGLGVDDNLFYDEVPIEILHCQVKKLRNKEVAFVNVLSMNHLVEGSTWEAKAVMMFRYSYVFYSLMLDIPLYRESNA